MLQIGRSVLPHQFSLQHRHLQYKHWDIGSCDCQMCKRRGTRGGVISNNADGGSYSVFNNYSTAGAKRLITIAAQSAIGGYQGFNYVATQAATSPETGSHCSGVGSPQGIAIWAAQSPATERSIFLGHSSVTGQGGFLIEANDVECQMQDETGAVGTASEGPRGE